MVFFNWATMQMAAKIVYYGPGLCGKTSNLSYIYAKTSPESRGEMVSLETESDRTLFFDLLPIEVGTIGGFKTRLQLYTVPGQVFYNTTRKLVLKGVDGLVFVADSQRPMRDANIESFKSLVDNLKDFGLEISDLPMVLQYNKRDLKDILSIEELNSDLNPEGEFQFFESSAINGDGVITTLKEITKLTLKKLKLRMTAPEEAPSASKIAAPTIRPVKPPQPAPPISAQSLARAAEEGVGEKAAAQTEVASGATPPPAPEPELPERPKLEISEEELFATPDGATPATEVVPPTASEPAEPIGDEPSQPFPEAEFTPVEDAPAAAAPTETPAETDDGEAIEVEFDAETSTGPAEPPQVKRVQVSNQMDILAELDGLRKQATMGVGGRPAEGSTPDLDLDSLISDDEDQSRELRRKIEQAVNSDIFKTMRGMQIAIRLQNEGGETIHSFEPVSLEIEDAAALKKLCLRFSLDLENLR